MTRRSVSFSIMLMVVSTITAHADVESWIAFGPGIMSYTERVSDGINSGELTMDTFGIDLSAVSFWNASEVGLYSRSHIYWPTSLTVSSAGQTATADLSVYDFLMGVSISMGPMFRIPLSSSTTLGLGPGFNVSQLTGNYEYYISATETLFYSFAAYALGISADALIKTDLNDSFFLFGRFSFLYDYYGFGIATINYDTFTYSGSANSTGVFGSFGFGFNIYRRQRAFLGSPTED
jgi:hypothetical protein